MLVLEQLLVVFVRGLAVRRVIAVVRIRESTVKLATDFLDRLASRAALVLNGPVVASPQIARDAVRFIGRFNGRSRKICLALLGVCGLLRHWWFLCGGRHVGDGALAGSALKVLGRLYFLWDIVAQH